MNPGAEKVVQKLRQQVTAEYPTKLYQSLSRRTEAGIALRATDLRFSLESNCLKKSTSQLLLFINRCHVCCSQQKTSDYSVKNR